jgi:hypothetical protein
VKPTPEKTVDGDYFFLFCAFCIAFALTIRACNPKYRETPIASHWSIDALSNDTRSLEYIASGELLPSTRTLPL